MSDLRCWNQSKKVFGHRDCMILHGYRPVFPLPFSHACRRQQAPRRATGCNCIIMKTKWIILLLVFGLLEKIWPEGEECRLFVFPSDRHRVP